MSLRIAASAFALALGVMSISSPASAAFARSFLRAVQITDSGNDLFHAIAGSMRLRYPEEITFQRIQALLRSEASLQPISRRLDEIAAEAFQTLHREGRLSSSNLSTFLRSMTENEFGLLYGYLRSADSHLDEVIELVPIRARNNFLVPDPIIRRPR